MFLFLLLPLLLLNWNNSAGKALGSTSSISPPRCFPHTVLLVTFSPISELLRLRLDFIFVPKLQIPILLHQDRDHPFIQHERHTQFRGQCILDFQDFDRSGTASSKGRVKEAEQTLHLTLSLSSLHLPPPCCPSLPLVKCHRTMMMREHHGPTGSVCYHSDFTHRKNEGHQLGETCPK